MCSCPLLPEGAFAAPLPFDFSLYIYRRVHIVHILLVQLFPQKLNGFAKSLEMHDLSLAKELNHIVYIGVVRKPQDVIVGSPRLLLWERIA